MTSQGFCRRCVLWGLLHQGHHVPRASPFGRLSLRTCLFCKSSRTLVQCLLSGASGRWVLLEPSCHWVHSCSPPALGLGAQGGKARGGGLLCSGSRPCPASRLCRCGASVGGLPPCATPGSSAVVPAGAGDLLKNSASQASACPCVCSGAWPGVEFRQAVPGNTG